jgi:hypothetical protein
MFTSLLLISLFFGLSPSELQAEPSSSLGDGPSSLEDGEVRVERGALLPPIYASRHEVLEYRAYISFGFLETSVGTVTITSDVDPYQESLLLSPPRKRGAKAAEGDRAENDAAASPPGEVPEEEPEEAKHTVHFRVHAKGDYSLYSMDARIDTRILPQEWPRYSYRYVHEGTENRRREILLGRREGGWQSSYRKDTRKGAPKGTRIWKEPATREIPEGTLDMLSALFLTRTLVRDDLRVLRFPLIDKKTLWRLRLTKGKRKRMEISAGTFDVVEIILSPSAFPGEEAKEGKKEKFEGLFGIHGSIHLWADHQTGIPVRIQGDLPIGPLSLGIDVVLRKYEGTPSAFQPVQ